MKSGFHAASFDTFFTVSQQRSRPSGGGTWGQGGHGPYFSKVPILPPLAVCL